VLEFHVRPGLSPGAMTMGCADMLLRSTTLLLLVSCLLDGIALGQRPGPDAPGFAVGPMKVEVAGRPGRSGRASFTVVTRNAPGPLRFRIGIRDLGQISLGRSTPVDVGSGARSCAAWLTVERELFIPPNSRIEVPLQFAFPSDASGSYFALVTTQLETDAVSAPMAVALNPAVSVLVEASVPGAAPAHVDITAIELPRSPAAGGAAVRATFSNRGVWRSTIEGDLLLYARDGSFPVRVPIPSQAGGQPLQIFPGLSYEVPIPLPRALAAGSYRVVGRLVLNGRWRTENEFELEVGSSDGGASVRHLGNAEYDIALQVDPDLIELPVPPGAMRSVPLRIFSLDSRPLDIRASVVDVRMEANGLATFPESQPDESHWVEVTPASLRLLPGRASTLRTAISVPRHRPPGNAVTRAVRIQASARSAEEEWSSVGETIVLVVAVDPTASEAELELEPIELVRPAQDRNPTTALVRVRNAGGRVARLQGEILLSRSSGEVAARLLVGGAGSDVLLPGGVRELRFPIPIVDDGEFLVRARLKPSATARPVLAETGFQSDLALPVGLERDEQAGRRGAGDVEDR